MSFFLHIKLPWAVGEIWSTQNYNVKVSFGKMWSTMALQLKFMTCVIEVLHVRNICKLLFTPALFEFESNFSDRILFECKINAQNDLR